jgi:hypothetical protein
VAGAFSTLYDPVRRSIDPSGLDCERWLGWAFNSAAAAEDQILPAGHNWYQWGLPGNLDLQIDAENHCCACGSEEASERPDGDTASSMPSV